MSICQTDVSAASSKPEVDDMFVGLQAAREIFNMYKMSSMSQLMHFSRASVVCADVLLKYTSLAGHFNMHCFQTKDIPASRADTLKTQAK